MKIKILIIVMLQTVFHKCNSSAKCHKAEFCKKNRVYAVKDKLLGNFRQNKSFILKRVILALEQTMALRL